jgi:hypothetical protein
MILQCASAAVHVLDRFHTEQHTVLTRTRWLARAGVRKVEVAQM